MILSIISGSNIFFIFLYHLMLLFLKKRNIKELIYFLIFIFTVLLYHFSRLYIIENNLIFKPITSTILNIQASFVVLACYKFIITITDYKNIILEILLTILISLISLFILISFFAYSSEYSYILKIIILILFILTGLYFFSFCIILIKHKKTIIKKKLLIFIALSFLVISFIFAALYLFMRNQVLLINYNILIFISCFIFTFILAYDFSSDNNKLFILNQNLEQEVDERTKQLKEEKNNKTNFFVNVAHELKTNMTLIKNYTEKYISEHKNSEDLYLVSNSINIMDSDIKNFLEVESFEKKKQIYNHNQIINFSEMLKRKLVLFEENASRNNIQLKSYITDDIYIKIDPFALDKIINNIVDNAIKYTAGFLKFNSKINVSLIIKDNHIFFSVKDNGMGIPEDQVKKIFTPFYQITHKKQNIQGFGMGLNIVKMIVDQINGTVNVDSKINEGSNFQVIFNKYDLQENDKISSFSLSAPIEHDFTNIPNRPYHKEKKAILIVEDNRNMRSFLNDCFKDEYNVYLAKNGKDGLNTLDIMPDPAIIISDIMMDEMDGYTMFSEILKNEEFKSIPVIFATAKVGEKEKLKGLSLGVIDFINKPFNIIELKEKVRSMITIIDTKTDQIEKKQNAKIKIDIKDLNLNNEEKLILELMKNGFVQKEIADKINISNSKLKRIIKEIYKKFGVSSKTELIDMFK